LTRLVEPQGGALPNTFQTFVGIDGGSERHRVCIRDWAGELIEQRWIEHSGSSLVERLEWLRTKVGNRPAGMAISIEIPHGAIVETLVENSFAVFSINPKQLDRFRDRYSPAGPRTTGATLGGWPIRCAQICTVFIACGSTPPLLRLRQLSRLEDDLAQEQNRVNNQLREQLHRYFPSIPVLFPCC
jgi:hypothetical protein